MGKEKMRLHNFSAIKPLNQYYLKFISYDR